MVLATANAIPMNQYLNDNQRQDNHILSNGHQNGSNHVSNRNSVNSVQTTPPDKYSANPNHSPKSQTLENNNFIQPPSENLNSYATRLRQRSQANQLANRIRAAKSVGNSLHHGYSSDYTGTNHYNAGTFKQQNFDDNLQSIGRQSDRQRSAESDRDKRHASNSEQATMKGSNSLTALASQSPDKSSNGLGPQNNGQLGSGENNDNHRYLHSKQRRQQQKQQKQQDRPQISSANYAGINGAKPTIDHLVSESDLLTSSTSSTSLTNARFQDTIPNMYGEPQTSPTAAEPQLNHDKQPISGSMTNGQLDHKIKLNTEEEVRFRSTSGSSHNNNNNTSTTQHPNKGSVRSTRSLIPNIGSGNNSSIDNDNFRNTFSSHNQQNGYDAKRSTIGGVTGFGGHSQNGGLTKFNGIVDPGAVKIYLNGTHSRLSAKSLTPSEATLRRASRRSSNSTLTPETIDDNCSIVSNRNSNNNSYFMNTDSSSNHHSNNSPAIKHSNSNNRFSSQSSKRSQRQNSSPTSSSKIQQNHDNILQYNSNGNSNITNSSANSNFEPSQSSIKQNGVSSSQVFNNASSNHGISRSVSAYDSGFSSSASNTLKPPPCNSTASANYNNNNSNQHISSVNDIDDEVDYYFMSSNNSRGGGGGALPKRLASDSQSITSVLLQRQSHDNVDKIIIGNFPTVSNGHVRSSEKQAGYNMPKSHSNNNNGGDSNQCLYIQQQISNSGITPESEKTATIASRGSLKKRSTLGGIRSRAVSEGSLRAKQRGSQQQLQKDSMLTDRDVLQVESMYSSHSSRVIICRCLANLYFSNDNPSKSDSATRNWELIFTGVPLLLLDLGDSKSRLRRQLHVILAEKGTGFALWRDVIDSLSKYKEVERTFHTLYGSSDHRKLIGLSFDNAFAATEFQIRLQELVSDPENVALRDANNNNNNNNNSNHRKFSASGGGGGGTGGSYGTIAANSTSERKRMYRRHSFSGNAKKQWLKKVHISTPCCFQHITSIRPADVMNNGHHNNDFSNSRSTLNNLTNPPSRTSQASRSSEEQEPKRAQSCMQIVGQTPV